MEKINGKSLINESTSSIDFAAVEMSDSIIEVDEATFDSFLSQISNYDVIKVPNVKVYNVLAHYNYDDKLSYYNSALLQLDADCLFTQNQIIEFNGIQMEVVYFEGPFALVRLLDQNELNTFLSSGIDVGDSTNTHTIVNLNNNVTSVKQMLHNFVGKEGSNEAYTTSEAEYLDNSLKSVDFVFKSNVITMETRKIKTRLTQEFVQDVKAIFDEEAKNIVTSEINDIITRETEVEVLRYIRQKSQKYGTLVLKNSYGVQNDLASISNDIYAGIRQMSNDMISNIKRKKDIFIIADSTTCSLLLSSPLFQKASDNEDATDDSLYQGNIGVFKLYMDPYAIDEYVLVGYKNKRSKLDAGLIFRIYQHINIVEAVDPENGQLVYWLYLRYGYVQNPQSNNNDNGSIFFSSFDVDSKDIINFPLKRQNS